MLPILNICILTYKRPWYAILTLMRLVSHLTYGGKRRFFVIDGGSPEWHLQMYRQAAPYEDLQIIPATGDVGQMMNRTFEIPGELFLVCLDDFMLERVLDITEDVAFLLKHSDVGHLRYGKMNSWDNTERKVYAELRQHNWFSYWVIDKSLSTADYLWTMGVSLMHRRMWESYGPLPKLSPHEPGETELELNRRFKQKDGPTVAVPMRIGQHASPSEPDYFHHIGHVRTDEYTKDNPARRWGAT